ncbi:MAG TPA: DNA polymerase IV [Longimicrobiales bacterium]|nr:DNA polymerase IV [Longimicrobiales bacterium]
MSRRLLLLDCDQFFVQCARIEDPAGAGREPLLLVGGSPDGRGVVTSASYETRAFGCRSGMPTGQALRLCPQAKVVPVPREMCGRKSREVRAVLQRFTPLVEAASIDEAYLDLTGTEALYGGETTEATARRIQAAVKEETGITVSIGGGPTRVVAKLAAGRAKPAGVHIVAPDQAASFMEGLQLRDIPGVGPVLARRLRTMGLVAVTDALPLSEQELESMLGPGRGAWLYQRIRGRGSDTVEPDTEAKSMSREETFPRDLTGDPELERELMALAIRVAGDLRRQALRARTVTVKIKDGDFRTRSASRTVDAPLESDRAIHGVAVELLRTLRKRRRTGARLLGVAVSHFATAEEGTQMVLFEDGDAALESPRDRRLSKAADQLRERFGHNAIRPGRLL